MFTMSFTSTTSAKTPAPDAAGAARGRRAGAARADSLQTTNPPAADTSWARLDRELTNLAIWLPTVTPNEIDLLSNHVGNYEYNPVWEVLLDQLWVR